MADSAKFQSSIPALPRPKGNESVWLFDVSGQTKILVMARPESTIATQLAIPFGRTRKLNPDVAAVGLRPGEWALIGPQNKVGEVIAGLSVDEFTTIVDLTHGRGMLRLSGPSAVGTLEKLCSIDLSQAMFPNGGVIGAGVAGVRCDVVRADVVTTQESGESSPLKSFLLLFDRSYGDYLAGAILDAMAEFL